MSRLSGSAMGALGWLGFFLAAGGFRAFGFAVEPMEKQRREHVGKVRMGMVVSGKMTRQPMIRANRKSVFRLFLRTNFLTVRYLTLEIISSEIRMT